MVFSVFTSRTTSLLASNQNFSSFLCGICVFRHYINIVSIDQEPLCSIQFQSFVIFLDLLMAYSKAKLKGSVMKHLLVSDHSE